MIKQVFLKNLTVIISCKDRIENLNYCISSISQGIGIPRVYIVDFGSKDPVSFPTKSWVKPIRVTQNTQNFHKSRAINIGIKQARTKYICVTDADQIFERSFFSTIYDLLNKNQNFFLQCLTFGVQALPEYITPGNVMSYYEDLIARAKKDRIKKPLYGDGCCHAVSREYLLTTGGYEEGFIGWGYEDSDMAWRAHINGKKIQFIHRRTSMIHLPHFATASGYYSGDIKLKNKALYKNRRIRGIRIANKNKPWGVL